jgi:hypothetical protein
MTASHIIHSTNGRTYDLTQNEIRNDLLPNDVLQAIREWPHGLTRCVGGEWLDDIFDLTGGLTYRAKPAPKVTEHVLYWVAGEEATPYQEFADTHKIILRHTSDTLPAGTYTGPDGAEIIVDALK